MIRKDYHGLFLVKREVPQRATVEAAPLEIKAAWDDEIDDDLRSMLPIYRRHTMSLLRKYFKMSIDVGRLPSVLGGVCFRAKSSSYKVTGFEDVVVFVHDVERCLESLPHRELKVIALVVLMEYPLEEAAEMVGLTDRQLRRNYPEMLDMLTVRFIEKGLLKLTGNPPKKPVASVRPIKKLEACVEK